MRIKKIEKQGQILVSGYQILSTGVNIKRLFNMVLGSPMKSYTTITQSIGRLMRLFHGKDLAQVFDIIDSVGMKKKSGIFLQQYKHRLKTSYLPEEYPIREKTIDF